MKMNTTFKLTVLGARGSMAVCRQDCLIYGGNTSCYMVEAGDETIFLDAGSGLLNAPTVFANDPVILLSHLHLDHLLGLGMYPRMLMKGKGTKVYVPVAGSMNDETTGSAAKKSLGALFGPPFWPLTLENYTGDVTIDAFPKTLTIGDVTVTTMQGSHPGGSLLMKLSYHGKSLVYATDFEHESAQEGRKPLEELTAFAKGTDLLLYDAQYAAEDYEARKGFGHSTAEKGIEVMAKSGAKQLLLVHHDPSGTDTILMDRESKLETGQAHYAKEGEVLIL